MTLVYQLYAIDKFYSQKKREKVLKKKQNEAQKAKIRGQIRKFGEN